MQSFIRVPKDVNWAGHWRWGPYMLAPITVCVLLNWIFTAAAFIFARAWDSGTTDRHSKTGYVDEFKSAGAYFFNIFMLFAETIHLPIHICLFLQVRPGWRLHPVTALTLTLIALPPWYFYAMAIFFDGWMSCECDLEPRWFALLIMRTIMSFSIILLYHVYMGFAAKAVHEWRGRTGRRRGFKGELKGRISVDDDPEIDRMELDRELGKR